MFQKINTYLLIENNDWRFFDFIRRFIVDVLHKMYDFFGGDK